MPETWYEVKLSFRFFYIGRTAVQVLYDNSINQCILILILYLFSLEIITLCQQRSQYLACSNGQLEFNAATGSALTGGVIDISVDYSIQEGDYDGEKYESIGLAAMAALPSSGIDDYDFTYVVEAIPEGTEEEIFGTAGGIADFPGYFSYFNDAFGSDPAFQVHEIGHNLGLDHSGWKEEDYGDETCVMGGGDWSSPTDDDAAQCFNAAKMYYLGWYSSYNKDLTPSTASYTGELVPTDDIATGDIDSSTYDYVLKVSGSGETDLFIFYNKAEGIIKDMTDEDRAIFGNHVMIYSQSADWEVSTIVFDNGLGNGGVYTKANWGGTSNSLKVEVCSITTGSPNVAKVIVYLDGVTTASCIDATPAPTPAPVTESTPAPTPAPVTESTPAPTPAPVSPPTSTCSDSTEEFAALKPGWTAPKMKTCDEWVKRRATGWRCFKVEGVAEACPETCLNCCVDSTTPFNLLFNKKEKTCDWAAINPELRCRKAPTRMKCAQTCGQCD